MSVAGLLKPGRRQHEWHRQHLAHTKPHWQVLRHVPVATEMKNGLQNGVLLLVCNSPHMLSDL